MSFSIPAGGLFAALTEAPPDPILNTATAFKADTSPNKVNLGIGAYRTPTGKPYVLPAVKKAEAELLEDINAGKVDKEYAPIDGVPALKGATQKLVFGDGAKSVLEGAIASTQALSGTGSLRVVAEFIKTFLPEACHKVLISDPTWGNHPTIFKRALMAVDKYPYWKESTKSLDFEGMVGSFKAAAPGTCVLLHACAHNPTGVDPSNEQWAEIVQIFKERSLIPILDSAYQGYASGSLDKDAYACRLFEESGIELFVCQSFAKNMGLYGERMGMVHVVCNSSERAKVVLSQLKMVVRPMYSSPPIHPAQLIVKVLGNPTRCEEWKVQLKEMADRILAVRDVLRKGLEAKGTPGTWNHITDQIGMFSYTGLTKPQCERLTSKHHIYLLLSGRISMAGLNADNVEYTVNAIDEVVRNA